VLLICSPYIRYSYLFHDLNQFLVTKLLQQIAGLHEVGSGTSLFYYTYRQQTLNFWSVRSHDPGLCALQGRTDFATFLRSIMHCFRKVAVHLCYGTVQLKCDGTRWRTGGEVRKVAVHLCYGTVQLKCDGTRWRTGAEVRKGAVHL
jgi:hypothetical protein